MKKCVSILLALSLLCTIGAAFAEGPGAGRGGNGGPGGRQGGMRGGNACSPEIQQLQGFRPVQICSDNKKAFSRAVIIVSNPVALGCGCCQSL